MKEIIKELKEHGLLRVIEDEVDIDLEIPHIAYVEIKKEDSKALLFTNPVSKRLNKKFDIPVLMNVFCCPKAVELFIGKADEIADEIESLLKMKPPEGFMGKIDMFKKLWKIKNTFPKKVKKAECQDVIIKEIDRIKAERIEKTYFININGKEFKFNVKISHIDDKIINIKPEYEDAKKIAEELKIPLRKVLKMLDNEISKSNDNNKRIMK